MHLGLARVLERRRDASGERVVAPRTTGHRRDFAVLVFVLQSAVLLVRKVLRVRVVVLRARRRCHRVMMVHRRA